MNFLQERRRQHIDDKVQEQAAYVAGSVKEQIDAGQAPPYAAYARVKGLTAEDTARYVGQSAIIQLGEGFMLDAQIAEEESSIVREGAIIRIIPAE